MKQCGVLLLIDTQMARKSTGKRLRFSVFERDGFVCQYCGKRPPDVILHVDHIYPVSKGGKDELENLVTSCADCNLGKATRELGSAPKQVIKNGDDIKEKYEQLKALYNLQKKMGRLRQEMINDICNHWEELWEDNSLTNQGVTSIKRFLLSFDSEEIKDAMTIASSKMNRPYDAFRYTCGILHCKLKERRELLNEIAF